MTVSEKSASRASSSTSNLEQEIGQTRDSLAQTIRALEEKFNPDDLREKLGAEIEKVEERTKALLHDEIIELEGKAKEGLSSAAAALKNGAYEIKDAIKGDLRDALADAKQSLRAATLGRIENVATTIGEKMNDTKETIIGTVRANPIPSALIGVGVIWLLMNRGRSHSRGTSQRSRASIPEDDVAYGIGAEGGSTIGQGEQRSARRVRDAGETARSAVGSAVSGIADAAGRVATQAGATIKSFAQGAGSAASQIAARASAGARAGIQIAGDGYSNTLQQNPLVLAGAALAVGAVIGFALPRTRREDELLGPARDQLLRRAGQGAQAAAESLANLAEDALGNQQHSPKGPARA